VPSIADMKSSPDPSPAADLPLARFLERIGGTFAHDLRTPLGAIVNYAAVLEAAPGVEGGECAEVRDLGRRIRKNAQRASRMIQLLASATRLASRSWQLTSTDLVILAQSIMKDLGGRGLVRLAPSTPSAIVDVDAEILGFVWRAFTNFEQDSRAGSIDEVELELHAESSHLRVDFRCLGPSSVESVPAKREPIIELPNFLRHNGGPNRVESAMGLKLAQDLVVSLGGDLQVWGKPGARSGLSLRFPVAA